MASSLFASPQMSKLTLTSYRMGDLSADPPVLCISILYWKYFLSPVIP